MPATGDLARGRLGTPATPSGVDAEGGRSRPGLRASPTSLGLGAAAAFVAAFFGFRAAFGLTGSADLRLLAFELLNAALIGCGVAVSAYGLRGARRAFESLGPVLDVEEAERSALRRSLQKVPARPAVVATLVFLGLGVAIPWYGPWGPGGRPPLGDAILWWVLLRSAVTFVVFARIVVLAVYEALAFARLGRRARVDPLDPTPFAAFAQVGLRGVLLWTVFVVILGIQSWVAPWSPSVALVFVALLIGLAVTVLVLPMRGVHERMRAEKQRELARVRDAIRRRARGEATTARFGDAHLADLVAYETRIAGAATWPIDASTLLRFSLYVSVGLGSWLGAALVERLLDVALR